MSFLSWPVELCQLSQRKASRHALAARRLIERFSDTFPEVEFEVLWDEPLLNAQAWTRSGARRVTLYGGLVRCPFLSIAGLALVLAHEVGHHLGGPPLDPDLRWPTWQGRADYWAAREAMPAVFGRAALRMTLRGAEEILLLHQRFESPEDEPDLSPRDRHAIFRAGALGLSEPACMHEAFQQLLDDRNSQFH
jgi:hypothetical protein